MGAQNILVSVKSETPNFKDFYIHIGLMHTDFNILNLDPFPKNQRGALF